MDGGCSCGWGGPGQSSSGLGRATSKAPTAGTGPVVGPDFPGFALMTLWKQCSRDARADYQRSQGCDRAKGWANNSVSCEPHNSWWGTKQYIQWWGRAQGLFSQWKSSSPTNCTPRIRNTAQKWLSRAPLQQLGSRPCPWQDWTSEQHRGAPAQYSRRL